MQPTYSILYGFSENNHHGKEIRKKLEHQGFVEATDTAKADMIITHSAGAYLLPDTVTAQLVVLVGVPMNQSKPIKTFFRASSLDMKELAHHKKLVVKRLRLLRHNTEALILHPKYHRSLARKVIERNGRPPAISVPQLVVVSNRHDPWPKPLFAKKYTDSYNASFISLPGAHDHIWQAPEEYVAIINYYASRLLT